MPDGAPDADGRELWGWAALGIGALAVAGLVAPVLALSRVPGLDGVVAWPEAAFEKGIVVHVVFSFVVWYLAVFACLLCLASPPPGRAWRGAGVAAVAAAWAAAALLLAPALMDRGEVSLNDYVPVIVDPLYYAGLALLAGAVAVPAARLLVAARRQAAAVDPLALTMAAAAVLYALALACAGLAGWHLGAGGPSHAFNQDLFWGTGHLLQFVNTALLLAAWWVLGEAVLGAPALPAGALKGAAALLVLGAVPAPILYFGGAPFSATSAGILTDLQYALAPPALLVACLMAPGVARAPGAPWDDPARLCLVLSPLLFGVGGVLGLFVDGADTRTPAHYHGVIAGINVAFMGLFYGAVLPRLGRAARGRRLILTQVWMFASGQLLASLGLFLAGGYGVPRKTAGAAQGLEDIGAMAGMVLNGIGAAIAVGGGVLFIWTAGTALLRRPG